LRGWDSGDPSYVFVLFQRLGFSAFQLLPACPLPDIHMEVFLIRLVCD